MYWWLKPCIIAVITCVIGGCTPALIGVGAGASVGTGLYVYANGELKRSYQASFDQTLKASRAALTQLQIAITSQSGSINQTIKANDSENRSVTLFLERRHEKITDVSVRVGLIGVWDRDAARLIHHTILQNFSR